MKYLPFLLVFLAFPVLAAETPQQQLRNVQSQLTEAQQRTLDLDSQAAELDRDLKGLRQKLVKAAADTEKTAVAVEKLEARVAELNTRMDERAAELAARRQSLSETLAMVQRFARTPPGVVLMKSDDPHAIAMAQQQLSAVVPELNGRLANLATTVSELRALRATLEEERKDLAERQRDLAKQQKELKKLVAQRQERLKDTLQKSAEEARAARALSAQASDLSELVGRLEGKTARHNFNRDKAPPAPQPSVLPTGAYKHLPATGLALVQFGQRDRTGLPSNGITLKTRPDALVTAVAAGRAVFAGPFRGYGKVLILEHPGQWHTVMAGLTSVTVDVGQTAAAGEPVGTMGDTERARELYFEVRQDGKPTDPLGPVAARLTKGQN